MQNEDLKKDEIDLIELFSVIWKERKYIWYSLGFFFLLGLIIAFTSKEEYTSEVKLIPEGRQQSFSVGLAQQFGLGNFQTPASSEGIATRFYPDIAQSYPFLIPIMGYKFYYPEINDSLSLYDYFTDYHSDITFMSKLSSTIKKYTIRLPFTISGWFRRNDNQEVDNYEADDSSYNNITLDKQSRNVVSLNNRELRVIGRLRQRITVKSVDGTIIITSKMPEPKMAAEIVDLITNSLITYIESYRTEKARNDVEFIEERYEEARIRFESSQENLARFRDQNRGQLTQLARTNEQRLQSEYDLSFNVYNTLARRLEESRLKLQEETPVVQVLEPGIIPNRPSEPRREFILTAYTMLGIFMGFGIIFIKLLRRKFFDILQNRKE
ncbi:MAG: Wzz/FepE/Etk N-terminal domain-containing protein [Bacteroidales bacterium]